MNKKISDCVIKEEGYINDKMKKKYEEIMAKKNSKQKRDK